MSNYVKSTNFTAKDASKAKILGSEHDAEYNAIAASIATKANLISSPTANNLVAVDGSGNLIDSGVSINEMPTETAREAIGTSTQKTKTLSGTVEYIEVIFTDVAVGGIVPIYMRLGTGGALTYSSTYYCGVESYFGERNPTSATGFYLCDSDGTGEKLSGVATFRHQGSNVWAFEATTRQDTEPKVCYAAGIVALAGTCNIVGFASSTNFNSGGYWKVNYRRST